MTGIMYFMRKGAVVLNVIIKGKTIEFYTPAWLMKEVLERTRNFGHFNPGSDLNKSLAHKEAEIKEEEDG